MIGIDGCKSGWCVAYGLDEVTIEVITDIAELKERLQETPLALIDIPIGLPDEKHPRTVEQQARQLLKGRASSVFQTPCREAVYADSYQEALTHHRAAFGKGISIQSWHICPKIKEVDLFLRDSFTFVNVLKEAHPEVCFYFLQQDPRPLLSKKTAEGQAARINILKTWLPEIEEVFAKARSTYLKKEVQDDDIIDALCLWVVGKVSLKSGLSTLTENEVDRYDLSMNMRYTNPYGHEL